jgi:hypothetical protein
MDIIILQKIDKWLKIGILLSMVILLLLVISTPLGDCDSCVFELEGKNVSIEQFMNHYSSMCLEVGDLDSFTLPQLGFLNQSSSFH